MAPRFRWHPIPAAPRSRSGGCRPPRAMAGSGRRLNSAFLPRCRVQPEEHWGAGRGKQALLVPPGRQVAARNGARQVPARCTAGSRAAVLGDPRGGSTL